ncbi:WD40/YVTN/BNR-like repeat-containing protein [Flavobacterium alkalisoli]|uniref:WD40/YVTN/BNR-like repeat-containing protein n=1 Tax=Flavobacterium alkalisoli TaxID=2602769 RepID=UPI003A907037
MRKILSLLLILALISCKEEKKDFKPSFTEVETDTLLTDSISIRAITIDNDKVWYAGSRGKYGYVSLGEGKAFTGVMAMENGLPEFRSIAQTGTDIFILNVGSPAKLYKIAKDGKSNKVVYTEEGEKVFYDSMQFYNDKEGIAIGDPTDDCLSVIITRDGGESWSKLSCDKLPEVEEGEAAFAASNTNLIVKGDKTWIVSGGKKSRVYYSPDKGNKWKQYKTPIVQGTETEGIYSADFYDENIGFAVGGDYTKPDMNTGNKIVTVKGGRRWKNVGDGIGFGYASCVQFLPDSEGYELVTAGPSGVFYSYDRGRSWKKILDDKDLHTLRFADNKTIIAAGQNKIIRIRLK